MKNYFCFFSIVFLIIFSCKDNVEHSFELECEKSKARAQQDFKSGKYIRTDFEGFDYNFSEGSEYGKLLFENNIEQKIVTSYYGKQRNKFEDCYEVEMNDLLENKFGKSFFDSLQIEGKKKFYQKHKDFVDKIDNNVHN